MKRTRNLTCKNKQGKFKNHNDAKDAMHSFYRRNFKHVKE